jgi:hypothetical protein
MSKPTRMLIVIALFAILAVVALAIMAHRYSALLERRSPAEQSESSTAKPAPD